MFTNLNFGYIILHVNIKLYYGNTYYILLFYNMYCRGDFMKKLVKEISVVLVVAIMLFLILPFPANATNEKIEIVKTANEYLIYDSVRMKNNFEFAYATESSTEVDTLNFINAIQDTDGNYVAYIDSDIESIYFKNKEGKSRAQYMWIKQNNTVSNPIKIDLSNVITQDIVDFVYATTNRIPVKIGQEEREPITEGNTTRTTTVGYLQIEAKEGYTYEYQLIDLPNNDYTQFVTLAKEISNFVDNENSYENISKINDFYNLYYNLLPEKWEKVIDNKIEQPEEAKNGDEYVVWIKRINPSGQEIVDVQFMTSVREEREKILTETETEEVVTTTKLPVTFDSNIILILVLVIIILAIIALMITKKKLEKSANTGEKNEKKS